MGIESSEAITWLLSWSAAGVALLFGAAWVYEKTRRKLEHPELGPIDYQLKTWSGFKSHYRSEKPDFRFELPGGKEGPSDNTCDEFLRLYSELESIITAIRPLAIEEYEDCLESEAVSEALEEQIESALHTDPGAFESFWSLVQVNREDSNGQAAWSLEFEVAWDEEHTRSAELDGKYQLLAYDLSCAVSDLEDE